MNGIVKAFCPFYERNWKGTICCTGIIEGTRICLKFEDKDVMEYYMEHCCNTTKCAECEIYQMLRRIADENET